MTTQHNSLQALPQPWAEPWPEEGLEHLGRCPVCDATARAVLHENLVDEVFRVAPGQWTSWKCAQCGSGYLDPRPTPATIGQAYANYFTHQSAVGSREDPGNVGRFRRTRHALSNGYLNARYGTVYQPASRLGSWMVRLLPLQREALDRQFRWLPKPEPGWRVLDVGCGNGAFLLRVLEAGWRVMGIDPDPNAVATARQKELEVWLGSLDVLEGEAALFDAITFSHVIEHVHDPKSALTKIHRLLKPGGTLYLETPNIQSRGHQIFGEHWHGIDAPRHLVLFNLRGLQQILRQIGFTVADNLAKATPKWFWLSSLRQAQGLPPYGAQPQSLPVGLALRARLPFIPTAQLEFITLLARKRDDDSFN